MSGTANRGFSAEELVGWVERVEAELGEVRSHL
jgi:hypothetical protein